MIDLVLVTVITLAALFFTTRATQSAAPAPVAIRVENKHSYLG